MPLNIISNFAANVAHRNLTMSDSQATSSLAKLSAGTRVLSAKDDAASLAIGSRLNAEIAGLKQASVNAGQAVSMLQIADGAMNQVNDILTRMKSLAVQAGSGQLASAERAKLNTEYQALVSEIDRVSADTEFAGTSLVNGSITISATGTNVQQADGIQQVAFLGEHADATAASVLFNTSAGGIGSFSASVSDGTTISTFGGGGTYGGSIPGDIHSGTTLNTGSVITLSNSGNDKVDITINTLLDLDASINANNTFTLAGSNTTSFTFKVGTGASGTADDISVSVSSINTTALGVSNTNISDADSADTASANVSSAIDAIQTARSNVGANQNRLEFASANLATVTENTEAARSQLLDLDIASEMSNFTSKQILVQAGVSMLAQANQLPQNLLRLFQ